MKVLTFSIGRLDWNIWKPILKVLRKEKINFDLVISSLHLSKKYGSSHKQIILDGYKIFKSIKVNFKSSSAKNISNQFSNYSKEFSSILSKKKYDFILIIGDRIESLALATTSIPFKIPIIHFHGGEISEGSYDNINRHAISKISHLHCVANQVFKKRLIQMGEESWRINVVEAPGIEYLKYSKKLTFDELCTKYRLNKKKKIIMFNFNSESLDLNYSKKNILNVIKILKEKKNFNVVLTNTNYDLGSDYLNNQFKKSVKNCSHFRLIKSLGNDFPSLLYHSEILIGNSSSGIIESCTFKIPTINIGTRQKGRLQSKNIINTNFVIKNIKAAINHAESSRFKKKLKKIKNQYGEGRFSKKFSNFLLMIKKLNKQQILYKKFINFK